MHKALIYLLLISLVHADAVAQTTKTIQIQIAPTTSLPPLAHPATPTDICEYLSLSGELDAYRRRWIAAVDKNRSLGAPYWPESFWTATKASMQSADLLPMYIIWYQHTISNEVMQRVLGTYHTSGADHFKGSPACFELGETQLRFQPEMDKLTLANTLSVVLQVYEACKPQIKAARAAYLAAHPEYVDR